MGSFHVFAQEEEGVYYSISNLYHQRAKNFSCEFIETAIKKIKATDESTLREELNAESINIQKLALETSDDHLKTNLAHLSYQMESAAQKSSPKENMIRALEKICLGTATPLIYASRGASLANSAVLNTVAFPLSSFVSFWNGFFSREKKDLGLRSDFIFRAFGPKNNAATYALSFIATESTQFLLTPNPAMTVLATSIAVEMITNYRCFHVNKENSSQVKFCDNYNDLKDFFHQGQAKSFRAGKKLQVLLDQKIMERRSDFPPEKFCAFSKEKQVKLAKRVLNRHGELFQDPRISSIHVLLPVHKNTCTKILIYAETEDALKTLTLESKYLEGIERLHLNKDVFPTDSYFSTNELKAMSFEESLCYEAESLYYNQFLASKVSMVSDMLKSSLAPSLLASPSTSKVTVPDTNLRQGNVQGLKNLIFSFAPNEEENQQAKSLQEERTSLVKRIKRDYKKTINAGSFQGCKDILKKRKVDLHDFEQDLTRINEIAQEKSLQKKMEFEVIEKFVSKAQKRLKLDWELIRTNRLQDITKALQSSDVANIIIISHGKPSGHLVDDQGQELPREAFVNISPSIQSLNFYSCHSKKLIDLYSLTEKMNKLPSYYKIRYLTNVAENEFMGETNLAPMAAFGYYLLQLDKYLNDGQKGSILLQENYGQRFQRYSPDVSCELKAQDLLVEKGSYAVTLNDQMIGAIDETGNHHTMKFPCGILKTSGNILKIKNIINNGGSVIRNLETFSLELAGISLISTKAAFRKNSLVIFKF